MSGKNPNRSKGSISSVDGQRVQEMMPASTNTGHPLAARVHRAGTSGK